MSSKRITAAILAAAALCMASCGSTADDGKGETGTTTTVTAATTTAAVTTTKAETTTAATTKKSKKKKATTTTMDQLVNAVTWNYPELKEPVSSYMEYAAKNPVTAEPDVQTFEGDSYSLKVDMALWEQVESTDCKYAFRMTDANKAAYFDITYKDYDEGTLPSSRDFIQEANHDYSMLGFPADKEEKESQLFMERLSGFDAVTLNAAVSEQNSWAPSERYCAVCVFVGDRLYQIHYSYPIYMPYADTGIEDILDSLDFRLPK